MLSKKLKLLFNPYLLGIGLLLSLGSCGENNQYKQLLADNYYLIEANESLTETLVHDIFSPPVASRIYAYPSIASYEIDALSAPDKYVSLMGQLNKSKPLSVDPSAYPKANYQLASLAAYYKVALQLIFTEQFLIENRDNLFEKIQSAGMPDEEFEASIALGDAVAEEILAYASEDNYHQSRSFGKYTPTEDLGSWKPTWLLGAYLAAVVVAVAVAIAVASALTVDIAVAAVISGITLGSLWELVDINGEPLWDHFGIVLALLQKGFRVHYGIALGILKGNFGNTFSSDHFGDIL